MLSWQHRSTHVKYCVHKFEKKNKQFAIKKSRYITCTHSNSNTEILRRQLSSGKKHKWYIVCTPKNWIQTLKCTNMFEWKDHNSDRQTRVAARMPLVYPYYQSTLSACVDSVRVSGNRQRIPTFWKRPWTLPKNRTRVPRLLYCA